MRSRRLSVAIVATVLLTLVGVLLPTGAATAAAGTQLRVTALSTTYSGVDTLSTKVKVTVTSSQLRGRTVPVTITINPAGRTSQTGPTVSKTVSAKRVSAHRWTFTTIVRTQGVGPVAGRVKVDRTWVRGSDTSVSKARTRVTTWSTSTALKPGERATGTVTVTPAYGRTILVQHYTAGKWTTVQRAATARKGTSKVRVTLPAASSTTGTTKWRAVVASDPRGAKGTSSTRTLTTQASTVTGWATALEGDPGATVTQTVTVTPSYGRQVQVQEYTAGAWTTRQTLTTAATATAGVRVELTAPEAGTRTTWRLVLPRSTRALGTTSDTLYLTGTTPPSPCNATWPCDTPAISNVAGRYYPDSRCGVTWDCQRIEFASDQCTVPDDALPGQLLSSWYRSWWCGSTSWLTTRAYLDEQEALRAAGRPAPFYDTFETLYQPDLLAEFNECRTVGCYDSYGNWYPTRGAKPFQPMPTTSSVDVTTTSGGRETLTVPGQGGGAQRWASALEQACTDGAPCGGSWVHGDWSDIANPGSTDNIGVISARGTIRSEAAANDPACATPPPAGKRWKSVGEIFAAGPMGAPHVDAMAWIGSGGHRGAILDPKKVLVPDGSGDYTAVEQQVYVLIGSTISPNGTGVSVAQFFILIDA